MQIIYEKRKEKRIVHKDEKEKKKRENQEILVKHQVVEDAVV